jgi:hypothetical protein
MLLDGMVAETERIPHGFRIVRVDDQTEFHEESPAQAAGESVIAVGA